MLISIMRKPIKRFAKRKTLFLFYVEPQGAPSQNSRKLSCRRASNPGYALCERFSSHGTIFDDCVRGYNT